MRELVWKWLTDCCELGPGLYETRPVMTAFNHWLEDGGHPTTPRSRLFSDALRDFGVARVDLPDPQYRSGRSCWLGIRIRDEL